MVEGMDNRVSSQSRDAIVWSIVALTLLPMPVASQPASPASQELKIQRVHVPADRLGDFLPKDEITRTIPLADLDNMLQQYNLRLRGATMRRPIACELQARFDETSHALVGTATWQIPAGTSQEIELTPWNLSVRRVTCESPDTHWGLTADGDLRIRTANQGALAVEMAWELAPRSGPGRRSFELRVPQCAMAKMRLALPAQWTMQLTSVAAYEHAGADPSERVVYFGGVSSLRFEVLPPGMTIADHAIVTYKSTQVCRFEESRTEHSVSLQLESLFGKTDTVSLLVDSRVGTGVPKISRAARIRRQTLEKGMTRWLFSFRRPQIGPFTIDLRNTLPPAGASWAAPFVAVENALPRGQTIRFSIQPSLRIGAVDPGSYRQTAAGREENGMYKIEFESPGEAVSERQPADQPILKLLTGTADVEIEQSLFLQLARDQIRMAARLSWRCLQGTLYEPALWTSPDWEVTSVQDEATGQELSLRPGPADEGGSVVKLQLPRPLQANQTLRVLVLARPQLSLVRSIWENVRFSLPEIRPRELPVSGQSHYALSIDPALPFRQQKVPATHAGTVRFPESWDTSSTKQFVFDFVSPLRKSVAMRLLKRPAAYSATHRHVLRRVGDRWTIQAVLDIEVLQGTLQSLVLASTRPLPENLQWQLQPAGNSVESFRPLTSPDGLAPYRYEIVLAVPIGSSVRLQAERMCPERDLEVPLLSVREADDFRATVDVYSPEGQLVTVATREIDETPATVRPSAELAEGLVWSAGYSQLPEGADVRLSCPPLDESVVVESGQAVLYCQSMLAGQRSVQNLFLGLDCRSPRPLELHLPADSYLWKVMLDGQPVRPWVLNGLVEVTQELPVGWHTLQVVYSHSADRWWRLPKASFFPPLRDWLITSVEWEVCCRSQAHVLATSGLALCSQLRFAKDTAENARHRPMPPETTELLGMLEVGYLNLEPEGFDEPAAVLLHLSRWLPRGTALLVDRQALASEDGGGPRSIGHRPASLHDWLERHSLVVMTSQQNVLVGNRELSSASGPNGVLVDSSDFIDTLAAAARVSGHDASGRFVTPAVLLSDRAKTRAATLGTLPGQQSASGPLLTWTFRAQSPAARSPMVVLLVPDKGARVLSRLLAIASLLILYLARRHWQRRAYRSLLVVAVLLSILLAISGGVVDAILSAPVLLVALVSGSLLVWRSARSAFVVTTPLLLLAALGSNEIAVAAEANEAGVGHRVLIPYQQTPTELRSAYITESLHERLKNPPRTRQRQFLVTSADYQGALPDNNTIKWRARFRGFAGLDSELPTAMVLGFADVAVLGVKVNGKPTPFSPVGRNEPLELQVTETGPLQVEVEFSTPILGIAPDREVDFAIPLAPRSILRLALSEGTAAASADRLPEGLHLEKKGKRCSVVGELGPNRRFHLRWREGGTLGTAQRRISATAALLLDITGLKRDLSAVFRFNIVDSSVDQLAFAISPWLVVRRVDAPGLLDWRIASRPEKAPADRPPSETAQTLLVSFDRPLPATVDVRILGMIRIADAGEISLPEIVPLKVASERGTVGIRLPPRWRLTDEKWHNAEPATPDDFLAEWLRLGQAASDRIVLAKRYRQRPLRLSLRAAWPLPVWSTRQLITLRPEPATNEARLRNRVTVAVQQGELAFLSVKLPESLQLRRVSGEGLFQWSVDGSKAVLLLDKPVTGEVTVELDGRLSPVAGSPEPNGLVAFDIEAFAWDGAQTTESQWKMESAPGWMLAVENPRDIEVFSSDTTETELRSTTQEHSFRVRLTPQPPAIDVRSSTVIGVFENKVVYDGRIDLQVTQGALTRLQVRAPAWLHSLRWRNDRFLAISDPPSNRTQVWTLTPNLPIRDNLQINWHAEHSAIAETIVVPNIELVTCPVAERWIIVDNHTSRTLTPTAIENVSNLGDVPADFDLWPAQIAESSAAADRSVFGTEDADWKLSLSPSRGRSPVAQTLKVSEMALDVLLTPQGTSRAISRWEILGQGTSKLSIQLAPGQQVDALTLGEQPIRLAHLQKSRLELPLFRQSLRQELVLYWSTESAVSTSQPLVLPRLENLASYPCLVRLRLPAGRSGTLAGRRLDRFDWLCQCLRRKIEQLESGLASWRRDPQEVGRRERVIRLLAGVDDLQRELQEATRLATKEPQGLERDAVPVDSRQRQLQALLDRRDDLVTARFKAEALAREASQRRLAEASFAPSLEMAGADHAEYYLCDAPLTQISIAHHTLARGIDFPARTWLRLVCSVVVLCVLLVPATWKWLPLYWSTLVLALGVLWLHWGTSGWFGALLVLLALFGAWATVRHWFAQCLLAADSSVFMGSTRVASFPNPGTNGES